MELKNVALGIKENIHEDRFDETSIIQNGKKEPLDKTKFCKITDSVSEANSCFIDGGNIEIIKASNFSLQLIRVCGVMFKGRNRKEIIKEEFFVLVNAIVKDKIYYKATCYRKTSNEEFIFDAYEPSLRQGNFRVDVSKIADTIRRYYEIIFMEKMAEQKDIAYIVRDGNISPQIIDEDKYYSRLFNKIKEKNICIIGIAKTNNLITDKGMPAGSILNRNCEYKKWYYPIKGGFLAKLHKKSRYIFKIEISNCKDVNNAFSFLSQCSDATFPGYPYGLMAADRFARATINEKEYYCTKLQAELGDDWKKIQDMMTSQDAHAILDKIG